MIHVHYFITRKPEMDEVEFHRYWREVHAPIVVKIRQLRRYVQSHRVATARTESAYDEGVSPHDGVAEVLLDGLDAFAALRETPEYLEGALADEQNFIDLTRVEWMATADHVILDGPAGGSLVKGVWQLKRKPGMALTDFRRYWIDVHGNLGLALPGPGATSNRIWSTKPTSTPNRATTASRSSGSTVPRPSRRRLIRRPARSCKRTGPRCSTCASCVSSSPRSTS
jgi:uncharacterized protein (TIGR02118 family)